MAWNELEHLVVIVTHIFSKFLPEKKKPMKKLNNQKAIKKEQICNFHVSKINSSVKCIISSYFSLFSFINYSFMTWLIKIPLNGP